MSRESPAIAVDRSLTGERVVAVLERLAAQRGLPQVLQVLQVLQVDNGPEFTSQALDVWAQRRGIKLAFSRPGTPTDNPFIEAFNGRLRQERLDQQWFYSLEEARDCFRRMQERLQHDPAAYRLSQPSPGNLDRRVA